MDHGKKSGQNFGWKIYLQEKYLANEKYPHDD